MVARVTGAPALGKEYRLRPITLTLSLRAQGDETGNDADASTRWETFRGQPHLVAPLVGMIGDSVVTGMSALGPEFVPRDVLALLPEVWNGCPICLTHPNGVESACTPETLSLYQFGVVFNGRYENNALQMEAWLSPDDAETVSPDATDCVNRILAGEPVEISICPWVRVSKTSGISPLGVAYEYRWEEILGADHVAILPSSMRGACSVDMGCGTPRALSISIPESENINTGGDSMADVTKPVTPLTATSNENVTPNAKPKTGFLASLSARIARISQFLSPQIDDGTSTYELIDQLYTLLRATEPGFEYVNAVYPETKAVVYCCYPGKEWKDYRRTYNLDDAGIVTLNDDRVEVVRRETWEPIESSGTVAPAPVTNAQCTCGATRTNASTETVNTVNGNVNETNIEEETMNETATATATPTPPVTTTAPVTPATGTPTPAANAAADTSAPVAPTAPPIDRATILSTLGISEADLVAIRAHSAAQTDRKQVLVSALAEAQDTFSTDQLNAMDTATLEGIADLVSASVGVNLNANANVVLGDFRGARPRSVASASNETYSIPDPHGVNALLYGSGSSGKEKKPASGS